ncbi:RsfA family transcriptional regulator [Bacillus sp. T33-2]|uniref:RsfA family transcriptional regulator n=1 Tax=Bacillus sp. T33-2 TaxID=2054168 RepID=UPI000C763C04|nr:RsfA family transcriptional regulator [Bacillus sp. T33-2]PLR96581.1 RsfA family transcriptional regulator [Bacillus sp. T33-2]
MKVRQDAWTDENDLLLAETVLRHVREGSTQLNAFEEVGDKLDRTSAACGFRWNAVVRHRYEKALQLAKKQRKQRQRILGKDQGGKKKLLYSPPAPVIEPLAAIPQMAAVPQMATMPDTGDRPDMESAEEFDIVEAMNRVETEMPVSAPVWEYQPAVPVGGLTLDVVISYLQTLNSSNLQADIYRSENERLKREIQDMKKQNEELEAKIGDLEQNTFTMQEDYETLMKIMNRARKLVLFDEEERPATKFKMDRNGNLEKVAE